MMTKQKAKVSKDRASGIRAAKHRKTIPLFLTEYFAQQYISGRHDFGETPPSIRPMGLGELARSVTIRSHQAIPIGIVEALRH